MMVDPERLIENPTQRLDENERLLELAMERNLERSQKLLEKYATVIDALSPLKTLGRGYSLTMDDSGELLTSLQQVSIGMNLETRLANGVIRSQVTGVEPISSET